MFVSSKVRSILKSGSKLYLVEVQGGPELNDHRCLVGTRGPIGVINLILTGGHRLRLSGQLVSKFQINFLTIGDGPKRFSASYGNLIFSNGKSFTDSNFLKDPNLRPNSAPA